MKTFLYFLLGLLNHSLLLVKVGTIFFGNNIYRLRVNISSSTKIKIDNSELYKSHIEILGKDNELICSKAFINDSVISVNGSNNKVILQPGVKLRRANLQVRGTNCRIEIGERTTFGQIRIVNVGNNNPVSIGQDCLFADDIEIWASDTHSIFDASGTFINPEKPVTIQNKVWVGSHVKILKGVTVKNGAIIGMNSIITKDIEAKTLCAGNPTRIIKSDISWSLDYPLNK